LPHPEHQGTSIPLTTSPCETNCDELAILNVKAKK
jgi:hypothetical protein